MTPETIPRRRPPPPITVMWQPMGPPKFGPPTEDEARMRDTIRDVFLREMRLGHSWANEVTPGL